MSAARACNMIAATVSESLCVVNAAIFAAEGGAAHLIAAILFGIFAAISVSLAVTA